jgi:hypothetical protein
MDMDTTTFPAPAVEEGLALALHTHGGPWSSPMTMLDCSPSNQKTDDQVDLLKEQPVRHLLASAHQR